MDEQFTGFVENSVFRVSQSKIQDCTSLRLTKIPIQAAQSPEGIEIDLSSFEGQAIMVQGNKSGCWIFSADVIKSVNNSHADNIGKVESHL